MQNRTANLRREPSLETSSQTDPSAPFRERCWVDVDLDAIRSNVRALAEKAGGSQLMAVVKADGYGHGGPEVAAAALEGGATRLAVTVPDEGIALRRHGVPESIPILVLGPTSPALAATVLRYRLEQAVSSSELVKALAMEARRLGVAAKVHLKVDTGMGRLGVPPGEDALEMARSISSTEGLELAGVMTHFAESENEDPTFTLEQLRRFSDLLHRLSENRINYGVAHAANSAATARIAEARLGCVRIGIMMYGLYPGHSLADQVNVRPALSWSSRIRHVKRIGPGCTIGYGRTYASSGSEVIATVPVGYADGLRRGLSNRGEVLVGGTRAPIVGAISMDLLTIRIPEPLASKAGSIERLLGQEVVLIGHQGGERISADDVASLLGSINYEVVTGIGWRVPRIYHKGGTPRRARSALVAEDF